MLRTFTFLLPLFALFSFPASAQSIDAKINQLMQPLTDILSALSSIPCRCRDASAADCRLAYCRRFLFTFYLGFINLRGFGYAVKVVRGALYDDKHDGEISHFQALTTAMSGTIGVGNIAGVASPYH